MPSPRDPTSPPRDDASRGWLPVLGPAIEANGAIYAGNRCPYCSSRLAKLPIKDVKCPSCRRQIVRIRGDDFVVYLLREEDLEPLRQEMDAHWALTHMVEPGWRWDPEALRGLRRAWLARYEALGVSVRVVVWKNEPCGVCLTLSNTVFEPATAPELPLRECQNIYCNCRYEPVLRA